MPIWLTPAPLSLTPESAGRRAGPVESLIQQFIPVGEETGEQP
jgi:hypothetical protein